MTSTAVFAIVAPINYILDMNVPVDSMIDHLADSYNSLANAGHLDVARSLSVAIEEDATEEEMRADLTVVRDRIRCLATA